MTLRVQQIGNRLAIILPNIIVENLRIKDGDEIQLIETDAGIQISPFDQKFSQWAEAYREGNKQYRDTLKELAK